MKGGDIVGACDYVQEFVTGDIRKKIDEVVEMVTSNYEDEDNLAYSGDINTIFFKREYSKSFKTKEEKDNFIEDRLQALDKREGEIVDLGVMSAIIKDLSLVATVNKYAHNEDGTAREVKWGIIFDNEQDAKKYLEAFDISGVFVEYYGMLNSGYVVVTSLCWDTDKASEQFEKEQELVQLVENKIGVSIKDGIVDMGILSGDFYWGHVETIVF